MIQGDLGLTIRAPEPVKPTLVAKLTPRYINKWLESLPIANISDSSRRLYQMLLDCNKSHLSDEDRFKILTALQPSIQMVLKSLSKHFTGHTLNLSDKQKKIAALVQAIHTEMAIGFKTIIEHQAATPSLLNKTMLHTSLYLSLDYLSLTVVRCYQVYTDVPARLWSEINTIYRFSITQKLLDKPCVLQGNQTEVTINDAFRKICLLSIANPYQLRQQEIETVYSGLQVYVPFCKLEQSSRFDNRYVVDLNLALPPTHQALIKIRPSQYTLSLNLDQIVTELQKSLKQKRGNARDEMAIGGLSARLIRHLLKSWAHLSSRHFARTPCNGQISVSIGLSATHQLLLGEEIEDYVESLDQYEGSLQNATLVDDNSTADMLSNFGNQSYVNATSDEDIWAKLYRPKGALPDTQEIDYSQQFSASGEASHPHYEFDYAEIINISPGGYCIDLGENPPHNTQTGEVIGLVETDEQGEQNWHIGVIRWIKRSKKHPGVLLGVQLIAPGAKPVLSQLRHGKTNGKDFQNALLLPELKGIGQPATIITNPAVFNAQQKITIVDGDESFNAQLTKLVSSSQGYRQFYFERLNGPGNTSSNSQTNNPKEDGFDNVWDLI